MAASGNNTNNTNTPTIKMDPGFYEEAQQQQQQYATSSAGGGQVNRLKRNMTLDLNSAGNSRAPAFKRAKLNQQAVLSSPDLHMLKLGSPELERLIIQQQSGNLATPTPSMLFPRSVTEEQELYARGFVEALNELHHSDSSQMDGTSMSGGASGASPSGAVTPATYTNLEPQQQSNNSSLTSIPGISPGGFGGLGSSCSGSTSSGASSPVSGNYGSMSPGMLGIRVKDEPQTVPSFSGNSPPMSPINMECQEKIKLERKRQRNRVAASKCRRRKLERISRLEDKVKILKGENTDLSSVVNRLKEQVCQLKEQVMEHVHSGCQIMPGTPSSVAY